MQDNAPAHSADFTKNWLEQNIKEVLEHPPQSPDLNPIEIIWAIMKKQIEKENYKNLTELKLSIKAAWDKIDTETVTKCIDHIHYVIQEIIKKKGEFIK